MKKVSILIFTAFLFAALFVESAMASQKLMRSSVIDIDEAMEEEVAVPVDCYYEQPEEETYGSELVTLRRKLLVDTGENFRVKVFMKNTGNMPWFSANSGCATNNVYLGTSRQRDRASDLYAPNLDVDETNNWWQPNRIVIDQPRTNPGEIASFTFWSRWNKPDIYKEYFAPVIEGVQWMDDAEFSFEVMIGDTGETIEMLKKRMMYALESGSVMDINLEGEKNILVDISDQTVDLRLDDRSIRTFSASTGKSSTPTPYGTTYISLKQEVRVGYLAPHYIMPKFMMFRAGGYGFHALPSLGNDSGIFWTEALSHLGIPVSHGCIRLMPEDADFMFDFIEVGTKVVVQP